MRKLSPQEELERFKTLPEDVKEQFSSPKVADLIADIGMAHDLSPQEIGILSDEIALVMYGMLSTAEFKQEMVQQIGLSDEKAEILTNTVGQQIFAPISASLSKLRAQIQQKQQDQKVQHPADPQTNQSIAHESKHTTAQHEEEKPQSPQIQVPRYIEGKEHGAPAEHENKPAPDKKQRPFNTDPYREPIE